MKKNVSNSVASHQTLRTKVAIDPIAATL